MQISILCKVLKCHEVRNPSVRLLLWRICCMINKLWRRFWFRPGVKNGFGFRQYWAWSAWIAYWMGSKLHGKGHQCMGRQARRLQSAPAHAKMRGPRKVRGPTQRARVHAKRAGPRKVRGLRCECGGRQVRGRARNAWAAVQLRGPHWVRGPQLRGEVSGPHCPALASQCPRNATAVPLAWAAMSRNRPAR